jgi:hypothetical protein
MALCRSSGQGRRKFPDGNRTPFEDWGHENALSINDSRPASDYLFARAIRAQPGRILPEKVFDSMGLHAVSAGSAIKTTRSGVEISNLHRVGNIPAVRVETSILLVLVWSNRQEPGWIHY